MNFVVGDVLVANTDTRSFEHVKKHVEYDNLFSPCEGDFSIQKNETCMVVKSMVDERGNYVIAYVLKENAYIRILQVYIQMFFKKL
jgi:hypothetical protein